MHEKDKKSKKKRNSGGTRAYRVDSPWLLEWLAIDVCICIAFDDEGAGEPKMMVMVLIVAASDRVYACCRCIGHMDIVEKEDNHPRIYKNRF